MFNNIGNDRPSTRVARPPGGASSISFGWDDGPGPAKQPLGRRPQSPQEQASDAGGSMANGNRQRVSSNTFACGSNQNCGNVLSDVATTRVLGPPGGRSSLSLAWDDDGGDRQRRNQDSRSGYAVNDGRSNMSSAGYPDRNDAAPQARRPPPASAASYDYEDRGAPYQRSNGGQSAAYEAQPPSPGQSAAYQRSDAGQSAAYHQRRPPSPSQADYDSRPDSRQSPNDPRDYVQESPAPRHQQNPRQSSNSWASGANANCGNMLTDVPTTRVVKPPGGASSLSLSWDQDAEPDRRGNGSRMAMQAQSPAQSQSRGFDRAVAESPGYDRGAMPAAGGGAAVGSGGGGRKRYDPSAPGDGPRCRTADSGMQGQRPGERPGEAGEMVFGARPKQGSNTFATGSDQNSGNVISDRPTTRVNRPPGGHSSFSLAWG